MNKAITTLATGIYHDLWSSYARPAWQAFCDRHGYELVVFDAPLDASPRAQQRSIAWQKLICHEQPALAGFDHVIWLDSDVVINPSAPDPLEQADPDRVSCCLEFDWGSDPQVAYLAEAWKRQQIETFELQYPGETFSGYSRLWGFGEGAGPLINTGFLLFTPALHGELLRFVYDHYDDKDVKHWGEMVPLSEEIHRHGLFHRMDQRYNMLIAPLLTTLLTGSNQSKLRMLAIIVMIYRALNDCYFLHFAGFKFLGMQFMTGATWTASEGFSPNAPAVLDVLRTNLRANGMDLIDDC